jgi:hypothetical protein
MAEFGFGSIQEVSLSHAGGHRVNFRDNGRGPGDWVCGELTLAAKTGRLRPRVMGPPYPRDMGVCGCLNCAGGFGSVVRGRIARRAHSVLQAKYAEMDGRAFKAPKKRAGESYRGKSTSTFTAVVL